MSDFNKYTLNEDCSKHALFSTSDSNINGLNVCKKCGRLSFRELTYIGKDGQATIKDILDGIDNDRLH